MAEEEQVVMILEEGSGDGGTSLVNITCLLLNSSDFGCTEANLTSDPSEDYFYKVCKTCFIVANNFLNLCTTFWLIVLVTRILP